MGLKSKSQMVRDYIAGEEFHTVVEIETATGISYQQILQIIGNTRNAERAVVLRNRRPYFAYRIPTHPKL